MGYNIGIFVAGQSDQRGSVMAKLIQSVLPTARCTTINLRGQVQGYWQPRKNTKAVYEISAAAAPRVLEYTARLAEGNKYDAFVCIDIALAHYLLHDVRGMQEIDKLGGMMLDLHGKPLLLHFDPLHTYGRQHEAEHHAGHALMSQFMLKKLANRLAGVSVREKPAKFILPTSIGELEDCARIAERSRLIAFDIETASGCITCIGFACETSAAYTPVFVVPLFMNIDGTGGMYWASDAEFMLACEIIGRILQNDVPKAAHNGGYDLSYLFRYGWYVNNYIFDTMLMMHSTWPTLPRALYAGCAMMLTKYRFWKDDAKEVGEDGKVKWTAPRTPEKTYAYWHYNALDCVNTLELCFAMLEFWLKDDSIRFPTDAAKDYYWLTYVRKFAIEFGPAFYMSMTGVRASVDRQAALKATLMKDAEKARDMLTTLVGDPDYNPNSAAQNAFLIYDVLDIKPLARKGRVTDKRILQKFADMHPIYAEVINAIAHAKEPLNNASKYGELPLLGDAYFAYQLKAAVTTTARLASSKHNFGFGSNAQNMPKPMRVFCVAEPGEVLVASDYSQSDSYFVAFESQDEVMIETVLDDRDTHSVHVEFFFGYKYEDVVKGAAEKAAWVVDPVTGVRQIIKKVSHGTNYDMGGGTMLLNIRREAAVAMVNALLASDNSRKFIAYMGLDASKGVDFYKGQGALWSDAQLAKACDFSQALYYMRYTKLKRWKVDAVAEAAMNFGVIPMFGGSSTRMLCKPALNPRFVPAAYGQGGTAGNINNAMLRLYYLADDMWQAGFRMSIQVHDELVCAVPLTRLDLIQRKVDIMEAECVIHGRRFKIPVEAELSLSWDPKNTVVWKGVDAVDYTALLAAAEAKTTKKLGIADGIFIG